MKKKICLIMFVISIISSQIVYAKNIKTYTKIENGKAFFSLDKKDFFIPYEVPSVFILDGIRIKKINPIVIDGFPFLPLRDFFEYLGNTVKWNPNETIDVTYQSNKLIFDLPSGNIYINDRKAKNDLSLKRIDSKIYFPAKIMEEYFNFNLKYDSPTINYDNTYRFLPVVYMKSADIKSENLIHGLSKNKVLLKPFTSIKIAEDALFINNNFPERIPRNALYETYINKTEIENTNARFFASHLNSTLWNINYIIRFENKDENDVTINLNYDFDKEEDKIFNQQMEKEQLNRFYNNKIKNYRETFILKKNEFKDFVIQDIEVNEFFSAIMDLEVNGKITLISFVSYTSDSSPTNLFTTPNTAYDYDYVPKTYFVDPILNDEKNYTTYSGFGDGYKISTFSEVKASSFEKNLIGFETGMTDKNINQLNKLNEIIDIKLVSPRGINNEIKKATWVLNLPYIEEHGVWLKNKPRNYGNLGNWNAEYYKKINIKNDTNKEKNFSINLLNEFESTLGVYIDGKFETKSILNYIAYNDQDKTIDETSALLNVTEDMKIWKIKEFTLKPGEERTIEYIYVLGTNSFSGTYHIIDCKDK